MGRPTLATAFSLVCRVTIPYGCGTRLVSGFVVRQSFPIGAVEHAGIGRALSEGRLEGDLRLASQPRHA
jgi:hypothetical protein